MDLILSGLGPEHVVLDLGCGSGSFQYKRYKPYIVGVDLFVPFEQCNVERVSYVRAASEDLPISTCSMDAVVSNHSMEHMADFRRSLSEIRRVLKPSGLLWISVPNGFGFDDALYRFLYKGGGHVNRFRYDSFQKDVETITGLTLLKSTVLMSSFIYTKRPESIDSLPRRLRMVHRSRIVSRLLPFVLNGVARGLDRTLHTSVARYGWGFVFGPEGSTFPRLPSFYNVCSGCGAGHPAAALRQTKYRSVGIPFYKCPTCNQQNLFFTPPKSFE